MNEKCTHKTSIILQDCDGFSVLKCTWVCGLTLIELHLDNNQVQTFTAAELAALKAENAKLRKALTLSAKMFHGAGLVYHGSIHDKGGFETCNNGYCLEATVALKAKP
jgi:predicted nucleic acid-binding Zn ribbon protein